MNWQKGMTLIEVLVSFVILSIIITPFLSLLIYVTETRFTARNILYANYAAVNQMEKLAAMNCKEISLSNGEFIEDNMIIKIKSTPWAASQRPCFYIILQSGNQPNSDCIIIPPEGGDGIFLDAASELMDIQVMANENEYDVRLGTTNITGKINEGKKPIIVVNAAYKPADMIINLNIFGNADTVVYSNHSSGINIESDGQVIVNQNIYYRDYILFRSVVEVYDALEPEKLLTRMESILRIPIN